MSGIRIYLDGACPRNGNEDAEAGWGIVCYENGRYSFKKSGKVPGKQTNNRAELQGLLEALKEVRRLKPESVEFLSDSGILVDGVMGRAKRRANRDIWEQIEALFVELREDVAMSIRHVPREENKEADHLATQAANSLLL